MPSSSSSCQSCQFACAVLRILLSRCCRRLCAASTIQRPEYSVVCLGLDGAGKSTILATLSNEDTAVQSTTGFALKAVGLPSAILNIQELGGGPRIRPYWNQYYKNKQAMVFVVDSSSDGDQLSLARSELAAALKNTHLQDLPLLLILNKADLADAQPADKILNSLSVEELCEDRRWMSAYCSATEQDKLREIFEEFAKVISLAKQQTDDSLSV